MKIYGPFWSELFWFMGRYSIDRAAARDIILDVPSEAH